MIDIYRKQHADSYEGVQVIYMIFDFRYFHVLVTVNTRNENIYILISAHDTFM